MIEIDHELLEIALAHLPVTDAHVGLGNQLRDFLRRLLDGLDHVVHEVHLAAAAELAQRRLAQRRRVPLGHEGLDGEPLGRRRGDQRQVAQAAQRHVQRARNRRGREREHVHFGAQRLQLLLVAHAEAMFLVDDDEPEILEAHVGVQQPMRGDDDVHGAASRCLRARRSIPCRVRKRDSDLDAHRPVGEAIAKVVGVLFGEQRGGHEHRHLLARLRGDERGAHRDFGLAEADVAAHHAIHGLFAGEILQHLADGLGLVGGFLEREAARERLVFQFALRQRRAALRLALRVQVQQLRGHVADLVGGAFARLGPLIGAELVQRRAFGRGARIARDQVQLLHGHVQLVAAGVFEHHELAVLAGDLHDLQAEVAADAIFFMHDRRTRPERREVAQDGLRIGCGAAPAAFLPRALAEELRFAEHGDRRREDVEPGHLRRDAQREWRVAVDELVPARDAARV